MNKDIGLSDLLIKEKNRPVLVYFYRLECKPCQLMEMLMEQVSFDSCIKVLFVKKDIEAAPYLIQEQKLEVLPTLALFKSGREIWRAHDPGSLKELRTLL